MGGPSVGSSCGRRAPRRGCCWHAPTAIASNEPSATSSPAVSGCSCASTISRVRYERMREAGVEFVGEPRRSRTGVSPSFSTWRATGGISSDRDRVGGSVSACRRSCETHSLPSSRPCLSGAASSVRTCSMNLQSPASPSTTVPGRGVCLSRGRTRSTCRRRRWFSRSSRPKTSTWDKLDFYAAHERTRTADRRSSEAGGRLASAQRRRVHADRTQRP